MCRVQARSSGEQVRDQGARSSGLSRFHGDAVRTCRIAAARNYLDGEAEGIEPSLEFVIAHCHEIRCLGAVYKCDWFHSHNVFGGCDKNRCQTPDPRHEIRCEHGIQALRRCIAVLVRRLGVARTHAGRLQRGILCRGDRAHRRGPHTEGFREGPPYVRLSRRGDRVRSRGRGTQAQAGRRAPHRQGREIWIPQRWLRRGKTAPHPGPRTRTARRRTAVESRSATSAVFCRPGTPLGASSSSTQPGLCFRPASLRPAPLNRHRQLERYRTGLAAHRDQAPWGSTYRQIITKWMTLAVTTMMWNTS